MRFIRNDLQFLVFSFQLKIWLYLLKKNYQDLTCYLKIYFIHFDGLNPLGSKTVPCGLSCLFCLLKKNYVLSTQKNYK